MTDLPEGWHTPDPRALPQLRAQYLRELSPGHPLHSTDFTLCAVHGSDSVLAQAPGLSPPFYLLHLSWNDAPPRDPHEIASLSELEAIFGPAPDDLDEITLWVRADTLTGAVWVRHLWNGDQIVAPIDPIDGPLPHSAQELAGAGWVQVTGPLAPQSWVDGALHPTGQMVEYWTRPVLDDFMLLRAIHTPGEPISLRQLIPLQDTLIEFDTPAELEVALPWGMYCRAVSPIVPRYGLSGFGPRPTPTQD